MCSYEQMARELRTNKARTMQALHTVRSDVQLQVTTSRQRQAEALWHLENRVEQSRRKCDQDVVTAQERIALARTDVFIQYWGTFLGSLAVLFGFLKFIF